MADLDELEEPEPREADFDDEVSSAMSAAAEQLQGQASAEQFAMPAPGVGSMPFFGGGRRSMAVGPTNPLAPGESRRERIDEKEPRELEDLYHLYPKIGGGEWKLRVERLAPPSWGGVSIAGKLGDLYERITTDQFAAKYGGTKYAVTVMAPSDSAEGGPTGFRRMKTIFVKVPGAPQLTGLSGAQTEENAAMNMQQPTIIRGGDDPQVEMKRMEINEKRIDRELEERHRLEAAVAERMRPPNEVIDSLRDQNRYVLERVSEQSEATRSMLADEIERLRIQRDERERELAGLRAELAKSQADASNTMMRVETEAMRQQKERHEEEIRRIRELYEERISRAAEAHQAETTRVNDTYKSEVSRLTERHAEERRNYESAQQLERERIRDETRARVDALESAQKREIDGLRRDYEARVEDLKRMTQQQLESSKERCDREVSAIRESERTQSAFARESAEMRITIKDGESSRIKEELESMRAKYEALQREVNKPLPDKIQEAQAIAAMTGWQEAKESDGESQSTASQMFGLARTVMENAPKVLEKLVRQGPPPPPQVLLGPQYPGLPPGQQMMMTPQQAYQMQQAQAHAAAQQQQAQQARRVVQRPQPGFAQRPLPGMGAPPTEFGRSAMPIASQGSPGAQPPPTSIPIGGMGPSEVIEQLTPISPIQPRSVPQSQPQAPAPAPRPQAGEPAPAAQSAEDAERQAAANRDLVGEFFNKLEQAVQLKMTSPQEFAHDLIEKIGPEMAVMLLGSFTPAHVLEAVRQSPGGETTALATRDGERFVEEVFANAQAMLVNYQPLMPPPAVEPAPAPPVEQSVGPVIGPS